MINSDFIHSIAILDLNSKIIFFQKRYDYSFYAALTVTNNVNKNLKSHIFKDYIEKKMEFLSMDVLLSASIKIKVSLIGECCIILLYSPLTDVNIINLHNQRMIESIYILTKTKKVKMDMLLKKYLEINLILMETIYNTSPKLRIEYKLKDNTSNPQEEMYDMTGHNIFFQKLNKANQNLKNLIYYHCSKDFNKAQGEKTYRIKLNTKIEEGKFYISEEIKKIFIYKKAKRKNEFKALLGKSEDKKEAVKNQKI